MTYGPQNSFTGLPLKTGLPLWEAQLKRIGTGGAKASSATLMAFSLAACDFGGNGGSSGGDDAPAPITGDAALSTGADTVVADAESSTITAPLDNGQMTLSGDDEIDGGAGTDAFVATVNATVADFTITNIETITVTNTSPGSVVLGFENVDLNGVTDLRLTDNAGPVELTMLQGVAPITIANHDGTNVTLTYDATSVIGATTLQVITLDNATDDWDLIIGNGIELLTLTSDGAVTNDLDDLSLATVTTLTLAGDQALIIDDIESSVLQQINGASADGNLTIDLGNATATTLVGGDGDDTFYPDQHKHLKCHRQCRE